MKFVLLSVLFAVINVENLASANLSGPVRFSKYAVIHQLFEMMRNLIRNGSDEKGVPVLDPYENDIKATIEEKHFRLHINMTDSRLTGLSDFYVIKSDFDETEVSIDTKIIFPLLRIVSGNYKMEGDIWTAIPLEGRGKFDLQVHHLTVLGKIFLKPSEDGKSILVDRVENPKFFIEKIASTTQLDDNFDDIFNAMIGDLLAGYINRFNGYFASIYTQPSMDLLNPVLDKFDTWQILATIL